VVRVVTKSSFEWAADAASTLAPIEVAASTNWSAKR